MQAINENLRQIGLPDCDPMECPDSRKRFPDGGQYRFEIPSTEGPAALRTVLEEAKKRDVPVHRVSQGSGITVLSDDDIREMCALGREAGIEVNLFVGPRATFDIGAQAYTVGGKALGLGLRGADQLNYALRDVQRAAELGLRSILVSDIGCLQLIGKMRAAGDLPSNLIIKTSVMMAPCNPASAKILEDLGANTINVASDLTLPQISSMRSAIDAVIDFYIEAPDEIGGFIRYHEMPDLLRVASPIYFKFGLRNSTYVYPSGIHLENTVIQLQKERVHRAQVAYEMIKRQAPGAAMSPLRSGDLGIPSGN